MIKILIVDDSLTEIAILRDIFSSDSDLKVIGQARNGKEALALVQELKPDIVTMDILMPIMDGFEATHQIMSICPTPIVVITSNLDNKEMHTSFRALEAGALIVLAKPRNITSKKFEFDRKNIIDIVRAMSEIKVFKRYIRAPRSKPLIISLEVKSNHYEIIAIGASVGGPPALKKILEVLPTNFPLPIVIVQHMTPSFMTGFSSWLDHTIKLAVKEASDGEILQKSTVYFAPDQRHLEIIRIDKNLVAKLKKAPAVSGFCPSISVLFNSVALNCGKNAIGILLTGMGYDGAAGLLELKNAHAHTLIQDKESSVVFGMASVAQSLGACDRVLSADDIGEYLIKTVKALNR